MAVGTNAANARGYAVPVLFPLDLFFLLAFGGFLACGSLACAQSIAPMRSFAWAFAILPAVYLAADLIEDCLLARLLWSAANITDAAVTFAKGVTAVKTYAAGLALLQTFALAAASLFFR